MSSLPYGELQKQKEAYAAEDKAKMDFDPGKPKYVTTPTKPATKDAEGNEQPQPQATQFDPNYGRISQGPISNQAASSYLAGGPMGGMQQGLQQTMGGMQEAFNKYAAGAEAGAPPAPFGLDQTKVLEQGIAPGHTQPQEQAAADILGTEYTGGTAEALREQTGPMGQELREQRSRAMGMSTGYGVAAEIEGVTPDYSPGERSAEAISAAGGARRAESWGT